MSFKKLKKTLIIAEIGNNHEGSFDVACKLIGEAKKAGVDAVKFQTYQTQHFINPTKKKRFNFLKKFELTQEQFYKLSIVAKKKNLKFISTPLDIKSAIFLNRIVNYFKIASGDNNYYELIKTVLNFNKPSIISTGLLEYKEIQNLFNFVKKIKFSFSKLAFLHCVSAYPVEYKQANLNSILYLKKKLPITIGYSDHTIGLEAPISAVTLGAKIIEKHFTLDNNFSKFRDHKLSLNPLKMRELVCCIRNTELMLGEEKKVIQKDESNNLFLMRRSIYFSKNIKKDLILKKNMVETLRPSNFYKPNDLNKLLGKKLKKEAKSYQAIKPFFLKK